MKENVVLVPVVDDDLQAGMPPFMSFMEKMRGVAGTVCHVCKDFFKSVLEELNESALLTLFCAFAFSQVCCGQLGYDNLSGIGHPCQDCFQYLGFGRSDESRTCRLHFSAGLSKTND